MLQGDNAALGNYQGDNEAPRLDQWLCPDFLSHIRLSLSGKVPLSMSLPKTSRLLLLCFAFQRHKFLLMFPEAYLNRLQSEMELSFGNV